MNQQPTNRQPFHPQLLRLILGSERMLLLLVAPLFLRTVQQQRLRLHWMRTQLQHSNLKEQRHPRCGSSWRQHAQRRPAQLCDTIAIISLLAATHEKNMCVIDVSDVSDPAIPQYFNACLRALRRVC